MKTLGRVGIAVVMAAATYVVAGLFRVHLVMDIVAIALPIWGLSHVPPFCIGSRWVDEDGVEVIEIDLPKALLLLVLVLVFGLVIFSFLLLYSFS